MLALAPNRDHVQDRPGYYDGAAFRARSRAQPGAWLDYARDVEWRGADPSYQVEAAAKIQLVLPALAAALADDEDRGACLHRALVVQRLLEAIGVWCYVVRGDATMCFPAEWRLKPVGFRSIAIDGTIGHCWVAAPPYRVIDTSLHDMPDRCRAARHLPQLVLARDVCSATLQPGDLFDPELAAALGPHDLPPAMLEFSRDFPPSRFVQDRVRYRYVPSAVAIPAPPIDCYARRFHGRSARELLDEVVLPALG